MNEHIWLFILPILFALPNLLPRAEAKGTLLPQHRWLPMGLFTLWIIVTCVHLYALDYVYEYYIRTELFAPAAWVLAWTLFLRCPTSWVRLKYALMFPALLVPLVADSPGGEQVFLVLNVLNIAAYGAVCLLNRNNRFAFHLAYASVLMLIASLPDNWMQFIYPGLVQASCIATGLGAYLVLWMAWQRNPKLAVVGSIVLGYGLAAVFDGHAWAVHVALQGTFVFLLLHSLRWNDKEHPDAGKVRALICLVWAIASFVWVNTEAAKFWMPLIPGAVVLATYCLCLPRRGIWRLFIVPAAALVVMASGPCSATIGGVSTMPIGLLAVCASFLFLGIGTVAALTRHLWHKHEQDLKTERPQAVVMTAD
jgi:hypothetical protein